MGLICCGFFLVIFLLLFGHRPNKTTLPLKETVLENCKSEATNSSDLYLLSFWSRMRSDESDQLASLQVFSTYQWIEMCCSISVTECLSWEGTLGDHLAQPPWIQ